MKKYLIPLSIVLTLICAPVFATDCTESCKTQCNEYDVNSAEYTECQKTCWPDCMKDCFVTCTTGCVAEADWDTCRDNCLVNCK